MDRTAGTLAGRSTHGDFGLLEAAIIATCVYDPDGNCVYANEAWERLWGLPRAVAIRYNLLTDPAVAARGLLPTIRRAFAGERVELPVLDLGPGGEEHRAKRKIRAHLAPFETSRGTLVIARLEDVTARIEEQEMRAALVDAIGDMGLGILLAEGTRILWANEAYERLTGYALAELTSADFDPMLLVPEETHETVARRMSDRAHGFRQQERAERVLRRKDGSFVRVEAIIRTIAPGPPPRTVSLLHVQRG